MASIHLANQSSTSNTNAGATPEQERDTQLLAVGKQCSDPTCYLVDFLPFKCQHCEQSFCQEHFKVDVHHCPKYDESKHNRVAPNCPLCNIPVAVRPGQDPNERMDRHLETECSVVTGKVQAKTTPLCARGNCKKVLFSPIRCTNCRQQFCPAHRFPGDHTCAPAPPTTKPALSSSNTFSNLNATAKNLNTRATAAGNATMAAMKKGIANASASVQASTASNTPAVAASSSAASVSKPKAKPVLPFSKMDRLVSRSSSPVLTAASESTNASPPVPAAAVSTTDVSTNTTTTTTATATATTTITTTTTNVTDDVIKPAPAINLFSWNFVPRPIFASA